MGWIATAAVLLGIAFTTGCAAEMSTESEHAQGETLGRTASALVVAHEADAESLVLDLRASGHNAYGSPSAVTWESASASAVTVCAPFVTLLLQHSYGWTTDTFRTWMGSTSPTSARYHDAIVSASRFTPIGSVADMTTGDLLAVKYLENATVTGHIAILAGAPRSRTATAPFVEGTTQYEIDVIDSTGSYHGPTDTRLLADGSTTGGIGKGVMRLYAAADGTVAGHTWSTYATSVYYPMTTRHIAVGRLP